MRIEFWGTDQEFKKFRKDHNELKEYLLYMGEDRPFEEEYIKAQMKINEDIEKMKYMKDKFVQLMDKFINKIPEE